MARPERHPSDRRRWDVGPWEPRGVRAHDHSVTERIQHLTVAKIMTTLPVAVRPDDDLQRVAEALTENEIGVVVVGDEHAPAGIVSERDLVRAVGEQRELASESAADIMTFDPVSVDQDSSVAQAAEMMLDGGIRHVLVTKGDKTVGILSIRDVLGAYTDED